MTGRKVRETKSWERGKKEQRKKRKKERQQRQLRLKKERRDQRVKEKREKGRKGRTAVWKKEGRKEGGRDGSVQPTCQPGGAAVDAASEAFVLTEGRGPVCFAVAVLLVVANLQTKGVFFFLLTTNWTWCLNPKTLQNPPATALAL